VLQTVFEEAKYPIKDVVKRHMELVHCSDPKIAYKAFREYWRLVVPKFKA
jgi:hypothetical protein